MRERRRVLESEASAPDLATAACRREISRDQFDCLVLREQRRVAKRLIDVFGFKVWIIRQDPLARLASREQAEQPRHRKAHSSDARLTGTDCRIDSYAREFHGAEHKSDDPLFLTDFAVRRLPKRWRV